MTTAYDRLASFLKRNPNALNTMSLLEMERRTGISRERVRQLAPAFGGRNRKEYIAKRAREEKARRQARLKAFLKRHPEAVNTPARGGMSFKAIGAALGVGADRVSEDWRALRLPDRASQRLTRQESSRRTYERRKAAHYELTQAWKRRNRERARQIQQAANRRYRAKVLRQERCVVCGTRFPWTVGRGANQRRFGTRVTCSRRCAMTGLGVVRTRQRRVRKG